MDFAQSALQGAHHYAGVVYLGARGLWYSGLGLHQLSSRPTFCILLWIAHRCILYQVNTLLNTFFITWIDRLHKPRFGRL